MFSLWHHHITISASTFDGITSILVHRLGKEPGLHVGAFQILGKGCSKGLSLLQKGYAS